MLTTTLVTLLLGIQAAPAKGEKGEGIPELGRVRFGRDVDAALKNAAPKSSAGSQKPVFLLFQEIPGCSTCRDFGGGPLSHPLLVEAIETLFEPVVVHNNRGGADAAALERFHEPAWNNPVVRFLDADGRDLVPRAEGAWSSSAVALRMVAALTAAKQVVPGWLALAAAELDLEHTERVVFAMHCFWEGQAALGALDGVVDARPGFLEGEVVEVRFAPRVLSFAELVKRAAALDCALRVSSADPKRVAEARELVGARAQLRTGDVGPAKASDDLIHLREARALDLAPLTRAQAVRVNAALAAEKAVPAELLSPRQAALVAALEKALVKHGGAFDGLERPDEVARLGAYLDELEARLGTD